MFLLAYLPIPLPGLKSVSQSKSFTSFSSINLLSYSSSSCKGVKQVALTLKPVPFYKPGNSGFLPRSINRDNSHFSEVLESCLPGSLLSVTCGRSRLGMNLNKPFGPCVDLLLPWLPSVLGYYIYFCLYLMLHWQ